MKKFISILSAAALLTLCGCSDNTPQPDPADIITIRWGMQTVSGSEGKPFEELNNALEAEGSNIRVEAVQLSNTDEAYSFADVIAKYEEKNGKLDIVTYGSDWQRKVGAANILFESGYLRELSEEDKASFTDIPEICWEAAKVNGKHYSVPGLSFGLDPAPTMSFMFNNRYIPEDKVKDFNCDISQLEAILDGADLNDDIIKLEYNWDYLDFTGYTPASQMGGLYFSDKTMKAENPYENDDVISYARALNSLYQKGYINYEVYFAMEFSDEQKSSEFAVSVNDGTMEVEKRLGKDYQMTERHLTYYMENRLINSTGITSASAHPQEAMELLKRLHSDKELSGLLTPEERAAIGLPRDNEPVNAEGIQLSPFAGFQLKYTDIDTDLQRMLRYDFDRLCKAEDFDKALEEINSQLKAHGIDDYVAKVNQLWENSNAASS